MRILRACGVARIDLAVGYRAEEIEEEIARIGAGDMVVTYLNPDYERGAIVSLWTLGQSFTSGEPWLPSSLRGSSRATGARRW